MNYPPDTGCEVSSRCVNCPLSACRYDDPRPYAYWQRTKTHDKTRQALLQQVADGQVPVPEAAAKLHVTERTIWRYVARLRRGQELQVIYPQEIIDNLPPIT